MIDAGYRGEVMRAVVNLDPHDAVEISAGDRIAQLVIVPVAAVTPVFVEELPASTRGAGGSARPACPSPPTVVPSPVGSRPRSDVRPYASRAWNASPMPHPAIGNTGQKKPDPVAAQMGR